MPERLPAKRWPSSGRASYTFCVVPGLAFSARGTFTALKRLTLHGLCPFLFFDVCTPREQGKALWGPFAPQWEKGISAHYGQLCKDHNCCKRPQGGAIVKVVAFFTISIYVLPIASRWTAQRLVWLIKRRIFFTRYPMKSTQVERLHGPLLLVRMMLGAVERGEWQTRDAAARTLTA